MDTSIIEPRSGQSNASSIDDQWRERYAAVRGATKALCAHLEPEDYVVQSMEDTSPAKWHLAHTTWFFETFVLGEANPDYKPFHPDFAYLFNSYYVQAGDRWQRPCRGLLSRPTVDEVYEYRTYVDDAMNKLFDERLDSLSDKDRKRISTRVEIGLNHEQQHQELLLTDIKHLFSINPLRPTCRPDAASFPANQKQTAPTEWVHFDEAVASMGFDGDGFFYDNEKPRHRSLVPAFDLATRAVTCAEYLEFMNDGGYSRPELWLSLGWAAVESDNWKAPLYWQPQSGVDLKDAKSADHWLTFTLGGMRAVSPDEPVTHISFFEADAYARWRDCALPTEAMWEHACIQSGTNTDGGNFVETNNLHPVPASRDSGVQQMLGNLWEWTASPYVAYPGYKAPPGALGEYNGKFMCNQMILRGGSCATPRSHIRPTYRNFFPPNARWQFSGIRLARYSD